MIGEGRRRKGKGKGKGEFTSMETVGFQLGGGDPTNKTWVNHQDQTTPTTTNTTKQKPGLAKQAIV